MQRFVVPLVVLLAGCPEDKNTDTDVTTSTATDATTSTPDGTGGATTSALTGVDRPANPDPVPTPDPGCASADNFDYPATGNFAYPWQGLEVNGDDYTCNGCSDGVAKVQGTWRVHGFANPDGSGAADYDFPDPETDYAEQLEIDGNSFEVRIHDAKAPSGQQDAVYRGWYVCGQKPERPDEHMYWVVTEVDEGSETVGTVIESANIIGDGGESGLLMYWYSSPGSEENVPLTYCKVGTQNPENSQQTCTSPFD